MIKGSKIDVDNKLKIEGIFASKELQPVLSNLIVDYSSYVAEINMSDAKRPDVTLRTPEGLETCLTLTGRWKKFKISKFWYWNMRYLVVELMDSAVDTSETKWVGDKLGEIDKKIFSHMLGNLGANSKTRPYAFAPIRTSPKRTYEPFIDSPSPEGAHVPMVLASIASKQARRWSSIRTAMDNFGRESGLFSDVEIRRLGSNKSDPFQILVRPTKQAFNLTDVGYGVSQVLPIIVDSLNNSKESIFLLQQPEVHLHPRAQAELGSFFLTLSKDIVITSLIVSGWIFETRE
jgi:hypothetical protein